MDNTKTAATKTAKQATPKTAPKAKREQAAPKNHAEQAKRNAAKLEAAAAAVRREQAEAVKAEAEQTAAKHRAEAATKNTKTAEQAEKGKEVNAMKTTEKNAAATIATAEQTAEAVKNAPKTERRAEAISHLLNVAKTAATADDRKTAAEKAAAMIDEFNREAFANAVKRATFPKAAEALKPRAPKRDEAKRAGFVYANAADVVTFQYIDEDGHENTRTLSLVQYAAAAFMKTATAEQAEAFAAALAALEDVAAAAVEGRDEHGKRAAAELTKLAAAVGLEGFATKTAEDGKTYGFKVDRSFVYAAAAPLRVRRGEVKTAAATLEAATLAALHATEGRRTKAEERRAKAEAAAVKAVFGIIAAAAEAAAVNTWKAYVTTAADVRAAAEKAAAEAAAKTEKAAAREAATAAAKREKAAKLREKAAALEAAAEKQEKTATKAEAVA